MNAKYLILLLAILVLAMGCNEKGDSNGAVEETTSPPVTSEPDTPPPPPSRPDLSTSVVSPYAGKVSLWDRSSGYDSAVFLPADYGKYPNKLYPMIISLHGLGGSVLNTSHSAVGGERTGFIKQVWGTALAKTYPAIVIAPHWAPAGSTTSGLWVHSQVRQLILDAMERYNVDPDRVVATGLSAGSIATQELIKYSKDLLAGAMPGAYSTLFASVPCDLADIPVWVFGNNGDTLFKSSGWQSIEPDVEACSNYIHEFKLTVYNSTCGHGCWDAHWAKPEVQDWLINQRK